ncbi:hypothetical protein A5791_00765 [Mycobacterium sp. 852002-51163_SCH5372311]|nr:hypothetical protein A5791_00765 [Mycobacterium sp. 852002-51163_SCH5372311]
MEDVRRDNQQDDSGRFKKCREAEEGLVASRRRDHFEENQQPGLCRWLISVSSPGIVLVHRPISRPDEASWSANA